MRKIPIKASFHDDPHEGMTTFSSPYGGPAEWDVSVCDSCEQAVGTYLGEHPDTGHPRAEFTAYLAIEYQRGDETETRFWCEDCADAALDVLEILRNAVR
jgi:hypothetical protein